jgi:hypothetical protein
MVLKNVQIFTYIPQLNILNLNFILNFQRVICIYHIELNFRPHINKRTLRILRNLLYKLLHSNHIRIRNLNQTIPIAICLTKVSVIKLFNICYLFRIGALRTACHAFLVLFSQFDVSEFHLECVEEYHSPPQYFFL